MNTTTLREFNADLDRRRQLAAACHVHEDTLYLIGKGFRRAGTTLARCIEDETAHIWRRVPKESLRPDVWEVEVNNKNAQAREIKGADEGRDGSSS